MKSLVDQIVEEILLYDDIPTYSPENLANHIIDLCKKNYNSSFINENKNIPNKSRLQELAGIKKSKTIKEGYVLYIGKINMKNGNSKYFNVYDTWGEDTTYEIWKDLSKNRFVIIETAGKKPLADLGNKRSFISSGRIRRNLFYGEMVDYYVGEDLKKAVEKYGNSLPGYTYK